MIGNEVIKFTTNNVQYTVSSIPGGGASLDELKKICTSIAVPADIPPTEIFIEKIGLKVSHTNEFYFEFKI
ncbi:MAG: hypothetical protein P4L59_18390 [Desulfosporosinus sp.]|nr:hypothetical protein [Desulfosporosinus sp.]